MVATHPLPIFMVAFFVDQFGHAHRIEERLYAVYI